VLVDQLRTAARQWQTKGRDPGLLWRGDTADEAFAVLNMLTVGAFGFMPGR